MSCGFVSRDSGAQDFGLSCLRLRGFRLKWGLGLGTSGA